MKNFIVIVLITALAFPSAAFAEQGAPVADGAAPKSDGRPMTGKSWAFLGGAIAASGASAGFIVDGLNRDSKSFGVDTAEVLLGGIFGGGAIALWTLFAIDRLKSDSTTPEVYLEQRGGRTVVTARYRF